MKTCYIIGAGDTANISLSPAESDMLIAADGGYRFVEEAGLKADWVVGDFDSLGRVPVGERIVRHPVMKDDTDMLLAVRIGLEHGCDCFRLYGGLGGRTDHTLANIQVLCRLARAGVPAYLIGANEAMTALHNGQLSVSTDACGTVSVFSLGGNADGVTLSGLLYNVSDACLTSDFPIGVSNSFTGEPARIRVNCGTLLICGPRELPDLITNRFDCKKIRIDSH